jgi:hypothetical protein
MDDDDEVAKDCISPNGDVFSYFMLKSPSEKKKHGAFTMDAFMSYLLVFAVLFIQGVLLYCVAGKVIAKNVSWQRGIMNTGQDWNLIGMEQAGCNDGSSLCTSINGTLTCAPPSVQLVGRWDELDTNKDDIWTREEVMKSRAALKCKYAVDPLEVFDVFVALLMEREEYVWLHPDVKAGKAIHKVYFTYIMGDIAICVYRNGDMCGNLVQRGFFDAALKYGTAPRVGTSVNSALDYCHSLLDNGGFCERLLPSTYSTWKIESVQECKAPQFKKFVHEHPKSGSVKSLLAVDYEARQSYETAQTTVFVIYKICIIFLWMLLLVAQLREVFKTIAWVAQIRMQSEDEAQEEREKMEHHRSLQHQRSELHGDEIHTLSMRHRMALTVVTLVRIGMLFVLLCVGLNFLGRQTDYIGLLLDGVALIFIVEVEEIVYARVLRQEVRSTWEEREPIELDKVGLDSLWRPDIMDLLWFAAVAFMAIIFLLYYTVVIVQPLYGALQCACLSDGERCHEALAYSHDFWNQYWAEDVPASIEGIKELKSTQPMQFWMDDLKDAHHSIPLSLHQDQVGRVAVNLLKTHLRSHHLR